MKQKLQWILTLILLVATCGYLYVHSEYKDVEKQWMEQQDVRLRFIEIKDTLTSVLVDTISGELKHNRQEIKALVQPKIESIVIGYLKSLKKDNRLDFNRPKESLNSLVSLSLVQGLQIGNNTERLSELIANELIDSPELNRYAYHLFQNFTDSLVTSQTDLTIVSRQKIGRIEDQMNRLHGWLKFLKFLLLGCGILIFFTSWYASSDTYYYPIWIATASFLVLGVSTPFLSILVETGKIQFLLLGDNYSFDRGIYYYKAKSVLEIISSLIYTKQTNEIFLGVLVGFFSLIAPVFKLIILPFLPDSTFKRNSIQFLWRFAWIDVMAVAIVVSFLASSQILDAESSKSLLLTGRSELEDGIIFFLTYLGFAFIKKD